jgi:hypothetical protein
LGLENKSCRINVYQGSIPSSWPGNETFFSQKVCRTNGILLGTSLRIKQKTFDECGENFQFQFTIGISLRKRRNTAPPEASISVHNDQMTVWRSLLRLQKFPLSQFFGESVIVRYSKPFKKFTDDWTICGISMVVLNGPTICRQVLLLVRYQLSSVQVTRGCRFKSPKHLFSFLTLRHLRTLARRMAALDNLDGYRAVAALFEAVSEHYETGSTPIRHEETILTLNFSPPGKSNSAVEKRNFFESILRD